MTQAVLYMNHQYVVGFMLTRVFAYGTIFFYTRNDYLEQNEHNL